MGWRPHEWDQCPYQRQERPCFLSALRHVKTQGESAVCNLEDALIRTQLCWHPDLGRPASRTVRNKPLLFIRHQSMANCYSSPKGLRQQSPLRVCPCSLVFGLRLCLLSQTSAQVMAIRPSVVMLILNPSEFSPIFPLHNYYFFLPSNQ